ncbi:MAG: hypothetical protein IPN90_12250 [Elusimicrobia bacterium]|nr:hypothetical protein [Elusimicrobiota bacterium]
MTLVEVMVASIIFSVLCIVFVRSLTSFIFSLDKNKQIVRATRLGVDVRTQVEAMDFFDLFSCDSSKPSFGFVPVRSGGIHCNYYGTPVDPLNGYKNAAILAEIQNSVQQAKFSYFQLNVSFLRRDRAATRTAGQVGNIIPFEDMPPDVAQPFNLYTPGDGVDDSDYFLRYQDINKDGDYFDKFWVVQIIPPPGVPPPTCFDPIYHPFLFPCTSKNPPGGVKPDNFPETITEMPDTRLKQVSLKIFDKENKAVVTEGWVMAEKSLSGISADDWESDLTMRVESPLPPAILYSAWTKPQKDSLALPIKNAYPADTKTIRADRGQNLNMKGLGVAMGDLLVSNAPADLPRFPIERGLIDVNGNFSFALPTLTAALREGNNTLGAMATKGPFQSPLWTVSLVYDLRPPLFGRPQPPDGSTVKTLSPFIGIGFDDDRNAGVTVAGIEEAVFHVSTGPAIGDPTSFLYDDGWTNYHSTWVVVADRRTGLLRPLPEGLITVYVEGGDRAKYKAKKSWTFTIDIKRKDKTPPTVTNLAGAPDSCDVTPGLRPFITCIMDDPKSGVNWRTIDFKIKQGALTKAHVKGTDDRFGDHFNPIRPVTGGVFSFQVQSDLDAFVNFNIELELENYTGDKYSRIIGPFTPIP